MLVLILDELFNGVNHGEDIFLPVVVNILVIKVRDVHSPCSWRVFGHIHKQGRYFFLLGHHFGYVDVAPVGYPGDGIQ